MPRFSVIVPIYGVELYINQCVDSLISQSYSDVEIILVDDGSRDNCPRICDDYARQDVRIRVIHKPNGGLVSARQAGCEIACGEYILNVDGDDWVTPDYFRELDHVVEKYYPDYICFGAYKVREDDKTEVFCNAPSGFYSENEIIEKIFPMLVEDHDGRYFSPSIWSKAIKREIYYKAQMSLNPKIKIGEDHACTKPALYQAKNMYVLDKCLYNYRINPLSMTKERKAFDWHGPELIGRHFEKEIGDRCKDVQAQINRNVVHNLFNVCVSQFNRKDKYSVIKKEILEKLSMPYYHDAIRNCHYGNGSKGKIAHMVLKYRCVALMHLYNMYNGI